MSAAHTEITDTTILDEVIERALVGGADQVEVAWHVADGLAVTATQDDIEEVEYHQSSAMTITWIQDQRTLSFSLSQPTKRAVDQALQQLSERIHCIEPDPYAGLAPADRMAATTVDCDLYHPWPITVADAKNRVLALSRQARNHHPSVTMAEQVTLQAGSDHEYYANSHGFKGHIPSTSHVLSVTLVAEEAGEKVRGGDYTAACSEKQLWSDDQLVQYACNDTVDRLGGQKQSSGLCSVVFSPAISAKLLSYVWRALTGSSQYQKRSFLTGSIGDQILPNWLSMVDRPHLRQARGSASFDHDGVATHDCAFIEDGRVCSYLMGAYSARHLGLESTGHAGGVRHVEVTSNYPDQAALLADMGDGVYITELMGQGVNMADGSFSFGFIGHCVEKGVLTTPIKEMTVAGNLRTLFAEIGGMAADIDKRHTVYAGSLWVKGLTIA